MIDLEAFVKNLEGESRVIAGELVQTVVQKSDENKILQQTIDYLKNQNRLLRKKLFGASSEKLSDNTAVAHQPDLQLFNEFELAAQELSSAEKPPSDQTTPADLNPSTSTPHKPGKRDYRHNYPTSLSNMIYRLKRNAVAAALRWSASVHKPARNWIMCQPNSGCWNITVGNISVKHAPKPKRMIQTFLSRIKWLKNLRRSSKKALHPRDY